MSHYFLTKPLKYNHKYIEKYKSIMPELKIWTKCILVTVVHTVNMCTQSWRRHQPNHRFYWIYHKFLLKQILQSSPNGCWILFFCRNWAICAGINIRKALCDVWSWLYMFFIVVWFQQKHIFHMDSFWQHIPVCTINKDKNQPSSSSTLLTHHSEDMENNVYSCSCQSTKWHDLWRLARHP